MTASPIRDSAGKLAITPEAVEKLAVAHAATDFKRDAELRCITALMIEAAQVALQTGRTPAELAALVRELREALKSLTALDDRMNDENNYDAGTFTGAYYAYYKGEYKTWEAARAALAKSEGV
jgi:hypothetical protein